MADQSHTDTNIAENWYVYCVAYDEDGPTKVGITANVGRRMAEIQWGIPYPLQAHFAYRIGTGQEAREIEQAVLAHFDESRLSGEWLEEPISRIRSLIIEIAERHTIAAKAFCFSATDEEIKYVQQVMQNFQRKADRIERHRVENERRAETLRKEREEEEKKRSTRVFSQILPDSTPCKTGP